MTEGFLRGPSPKVVQGEVVLLGDEGYGVGEVVSITIQVGASPWEMPAYNFGRVLLPPEAHQLILGMQGGCPYARVQSVIVPPPLPSPPKMNPNAKPFLVGGSPPPMEAPLPRKEEMLRPTKEEIPLPTKEEIPLPTKGEVAPSTPTPNMPVLMPCKVVGVCCLVIPVVRRQPLVERWSTIRPRYAGTSWDEGRADGTKAIEAGGEWEVDMNEFLRLHCSQTSSPNPPEELLSGKRVGVAIHYYAPYRWHIAIASFYVPGYGGFYYTPDRKGFSHCWTIASFNLFAFLRRLKTAGATLVYYGAGTFQELLEWVWRTMAPEVHQYMAPSAIGVTCINIQSSDLTMAEALVKRWGINFHLIDARYGIKHGPLKYNFHRQCGPMLTSLTHEYYVVREALGPLLLLPDKH